LFLLELNANTLYFTLFLDRGSSGSFHVKCVSSHVQIIDEANGDYVSEKNEMKVIVETNQRLAMVRQYLVFSKDIGNGNIIWTQVENLYRIFFVGILRNVKVVDTTGAGDAFIGGHILVSTVCPQKDESSSLACKFASWVAGKKLEGPGARVTLPSSHDVNNLLGSDLSTIAESLDELITSILF
jgi:hypothetical protein